MTMLEDRSFGLEFLQVPLNGAIYGNNSSLKDNLEKQPLSGMLPFEWIL